MADYILDLRKAVGRRPLLQTGAGVIVVDAAGRVLLQRRSDNGCWDYAGGSMELGEEAEETARRELLEETGLTAGTLERYGVYAGPEEHYFYPNGDEVYNVEFAYACRDWSGTLTCQEGEVDDLRFFSLDDLPDGVSGQVKRRLPDWLRHRRAGEVPGAE